MSNQVICIRRGVTANPYRQSVKRAGREVRLSPSQFLIFTTVAKARPYGIPLERLFGVLYAGADPPITGKKAVSVQRTITNKKLAPLGLAIKGPGVGRHGGTYELVVLPLRGAAP